MQMQQTPSPMNSAKAKNFSSMNNDSAYRTNVAQKVKTNHSGTIQRELSPTQPQQLAKKPGKRK